MTRQEELVQAARKEYPEWEEAQCHFIDGAHYADSHPKRITYKALEDAAMESGSSEFPNNCEKGE